MFYSTLNFKSFALPIVKDWLKVDMIDSIESRKEDFCQGLDMKSGIDFYGTHSYGYVWLATRMQWDGPEKFKKHYKESFPYDTFTIRKNTVNGGKTEFYKRKEAKEKNWSRPNYVIQGYITKKTDGELLSLAMCKQDELIDFILENETHHRKKDNSFYYVNWFEFKEKYWIKIIKEKNYPIWKFITPKDFHQKYSSNFGEGYFAYKLDLMQIMQFIECTENKICRLSYLRDNLSHISNLQGKIGELERLSLLKVNPSKDSVSIKYYDQKVIG